MTTTAAPAGITGSPYNHFGCRGCDGAHPLTLADRELLRGWTLRESDDGRTYYCTECLADLPADEWEANFHVCGEEPQVQAAPEPVAAVAHKTRTTPPAGYVQDESGCRRFDKRGRVMHDKGSFALCSCGWVAAGATREEARSCARAHRQAMAEAA